MEEVKDEEAILKKNPQEYMREVKRLKKEKEDMDQRLTDLTHHEILLQNLVAEGIIDE